MRDRHGGGARRAGAPGRAGEARRRSRCAWGIHDVVNENMAGAARVHIAERGRDPRDYALLCTGGAGPVHAYDVARKLGLRQVICPPAAGVASALGLLVAPARVDRVATVGLRLDRDSVAALESGLPPARGRSARGDGRHRAQARHGHACAGWPTAASSARASTSSSSCPTAPTTTPTPAARRADGGVRDGLPREVRAHAAGRPGRVHQHPRGGARAGGRASAVAGTAPLAARRRRRRRRQGRAPRLLPRAARLRGDDRVRPRAPGRRATRSAAPRWSKRKARRW